MTRLLRPLVAAGIALAPGLALAQYVIPEPPMMAAPVPVVGGPINAEDAAQIAMMHGMAVVRKVDVRMWDGNFKVKGTDVRGEDIVMRIDHDTGEILEIDD